MQTIKGNVAFVNSRQTSFGTMYGLKIDGTEYGTGKDNPTTKYGVNQGDNVEFSTEQNAKGFWSVKGPVRKVEVAPAVAEAAALPAAKATAARSSSYDDARQKNITRQGSRNTAVAFLTLAQTAGILPTPKTKGQGFDALRAILDELTEEFYADAMNPEAPKVAEATKEDAAKADGDEGWE